MKSMTGYGKAVVTRDGRELTLELKSVNHRFLDLNTKMPRVFIAFEDVIRNGLAQKIERGHIDVFVNYKIDGNAKPKCVTVDTALAGGYVEAAKTLAETFPELKSDYQISSLLKAPDVVTVEESEDDAEVLREMLTEAVQIAADNLNVMRENEGNKLRADILAKIAGIEKMLGEVKTYAPCVTADYRDKLRARITEALGGAELDENKLANEVCFFADKCCIDEEITRLTSHIAHAREILNGTESAGKKMDFLIQEFNRETNTICSKSGYVALTDVALAMKNEIEKVREQVQNLE